MKWHRPNLLSAILTIATIFIASPIFIESFGSSLIYNKNISPANQDKLENESKLIYLGSSILGQIGYCLQTGLNGGFLIFPIFECKAITAKIHSKAIESDKDGLINTLFCLSTSAILTSILAFTLSILNVGKYLALLPINITVVIMLESGFLFLIFGCWHYLTDNLFNSSIFITISVLITLSLLILLKKKKNPMYIFLYVFVLIILMNSIKYLGASKFLLENNLFSKIKQEKLSISTFYEKIKPKAFDIRFVKKVWADILSLSMFPLIVFAVNFPAYCDTLKIISSPNKELKATCLSNFLSSFSFYPTYFNCSGSILFHACGSNTPTYSMLAGVSMVFIYFVLHYITRILPTFVISLLTQFVGLSFLISYLQIFYLTSIVDKIMIIIMLGIYELANRMIIVLLITGIALNLYTSFIFTKVLFSRKNMIKRTELENEIFFKVNIRLDFYNSHFLTTALLECKKPVIVDLTDCLYIDITANFLLKNTISDLENNGTSCKIIGKPTNFYGHLYKQINNSNGNNGEDAFVIS